MRFRPDVARAVCDADFVVLRVEPFEDFVAVLRFGADLDFLALALAGARFFVGDAFAFARCLVGWLLERRLRAPITAPDTAPINVPTTGVPTAVPTTAPATAPPRVLLAAPFSSLDRISFSSSSVMFDLLGHDSKLIVIYATPRSLATFCGSRIARQSADVLRQCNRLFRFLVADRDVKSLRHEKTAEAVPILQDPVIAPGHVFGSQIRAKLPLERTP